MQENITFSEIANLYLMRKIKRKRIKHNAVLFYTNHLIRLNARFGDIPIQQISAEEIEQFFDNLPEEKCFIISRK